MTSMTSMKTAFGGLFLIAAMASTSATLPADAASRSVQTDKGVKMHHVAAKPAQVGIGLKTNKVSPSLLKSQIRQQALRQGVKLTDREVAVAVNRATNQLKGVGPGPQKGIIHLKFKRFTICISWGKDKNYCKTH